MLPIMSVEPPPLRLDHFLKREALVGTGGSAKQAIQGGDVLVNGQVETRRKRKLKAGDVVGYQGQERSVELTKKP
jgi:ribosome-associated protein